MNARADRLPLNRPAVRTGASALERAAFAMALSASSKRGGAPGIGRDRYGTDIEMIVKAASSPAARDAWGAELLGGAIGEFLSLLPSASGALINGSPRITLDGRDSVALPVRATTLDGTGASWVQEGAAAPVKQINLTSVDVGPPRKLVTMIACTREMLEIQNAENVFAALMRENVSFAMDSRMFGDAAADDTAPQGLLHDINPVTASAATDVGEAMRSDLETLLAAIAPVSSGSAVIVCNVAQAFSIAVRLGRNFTIPVWPSAAVPAGRVIALDASAFVSGFGSQPQMSASIETAIVMQDPPVAFSTPGTPATIGAPATSMFQVDSIALKLVLRAAWTMRAPAISWVEDVVWGVVPA